MTQYFKIFDSGNATGGDPYKKFTWYENDNGYQKSGYLHSASVSGCLNQIKDYIDEYENDFEIDINVAEKLGGSCMIVSLEEIEQAKVKYSQYVT